KTYRCKACQGRIRVPDDLPSPDTQPPVTVLPAAVSLPRMLGNSLGMEFVLIPAGTFRMGSPDEEKYRGTDDGPKHEVEIQCPVDMGVYPVTQGEYQRLVGETPSFFAASGTGADRVKKLDTRRHPVERVSWDKAVAFCRKLSEQSEEKKKGRLYRLP